MEKFISVVAVRTSWS